MSTTDLNDDRCPSPLFHDLAHRLIARIIEADSKCDPQTDIDLRLASIIIERNELRPQLTAAQAERDALQTEVEGLRYQRMFTDTHVGDD